MKARDIAAEIRDRIRRESPESPLLNSVMLDRLNEIGDAFGLAFQDAVRRHQAGGVPMAMWRNDGVVLVDPWEIKLPGEPGYEEQAAE
ncbi:MAG: hypothetical protein JO306_09805 [Gemmatimonadetes bacterium]|nr:hypothetical protein [Gemmatimonadota bacterium]